MTTKDKVARRSGGTAARFLSFAERECAGVSPLYGAWIEWRD